MSAIMLALAGTTSSAPTPPPPPITGDYTLGAEAAEFNPDFIGYSAWDSFGSLAPAAPPLVVIATTDSGYLRVTLEGDFLQNAFTSIQITGVTGVLLTASADDFSTGGGQTDWYWLSSAMVDGNNYPVTIG